MLLGQNLRRRHERRLIARFDREQNGGDGDDGFPGANITLQQPVHWMLRCQVLPDFLDHFFLRSGQFEGQFI